MSNLDKIPFHRLTIDQQRAALTAAKAAVSEQDVEQFLGKCEAMTKDYMATNHRVALRIIGEPDCFAVWQGRVEQVSVDGRTCKAAEATQVRELRDAIRGGQVQVELYRFWAGPVESSKVVRVLHAATGAFVPCTGEFML